MRRFGKGWSLAKRHQRSHGFTLVELLVVVSIIALLISILLPSLKNAREQAKATICLSNMRALGQAIMLYATEYDGRLPGPLHPAVYRKQTLLNASGEYAIQRQLTFMLAPVMNQRGPGLESNVSDGVSVCPSVDRILSDEHFDRYRDNTGRIGLFPFHYALNNYGDSSADPDNDGFSDNPRKTSPPNYFGSSPPSKDTFDQQVLDGTLVGPTTLSRIARASDEWALGDAWYRTRVNPSFPFLQQDGTFQSNWSGAVLPFAPPHRRRGPLTVFDNDTPARQTASRIFGKKKKDGSTQAAFFDGHAGPVKSKGLGTQGFTLFYGFPGTVNIDFTGIPDSMRNNYRSLQWE